MIYNAYFPIYHFSSVNKNPGLLSTRHEQSFKMHKIFKKLFLELIELNPLRRIFKGYENNVIFNNFAK